MAARESIKPKEYAQENPNLNDAQPTPESQNNGAEQIEMGNYYMTDFILDFLNRTLKNEDENQQANNSTERENEEESVEELLERAENMIRDMQPDVDATQSLNTIPTDNIPTTTHTPHTPHYESIPTRSIDQLPNIILSDSDSDDEVIFVNTQSSVIPVIDLSSPSIPSNSNRLESRKRIHNYEENASNSMVTLPSSPSEKQLRLNCAVCLDEVKQPHSTTCGHIYCGDCIKKSVKLLKKCPTCNKNLKLRNIHPIYL